MPKITWKVAEAPTGRYRSFERRSWPVAHYADGSIAAAISCEDDYCPRDVREGKHAPLTVRVADHSFKPWKWRKLVKTYATLPEAKAAFERCLKDNSQLIAANDGTPLCDSITDIVDE